MFLCAAVPAEFKKSKTYKNHQLFKGLAAFFLGTSTWYSLSHINNAHSHYQSHQLLPSHGRCRPNHISSEFKSSGADRKTWPSQPVWHANRHTYSVGAHTTTIFRLAYDSNPDFTQDTGQKCLCSNTVETERTVKAGRETVTLSYI